MAFTLEALGVIALHQHDLPTAEAEFQRALAIYKSLFGDSSFRTAFSRCNLAMVYLKESKNVLAESMLHQSVDVLALLPPGNNLIATARGRWESSLLALKRYPEARLAEQLLTSQHNAPLGELGNVQRNLVALAAATHSDKSAVLRSEDTNGQVH